MAGDDTSYFPSGAVRSSADVVVRLVEGRRSLLSMAARQLEARVMPRTLDTAVDDPALGQGPSSVCADRVHRVNGAALAHDDEALRAGLRRGWRVLGNIGHVELGPARLV